MLLKSAFWSLISGASGISLLSFGWNMMYRLTSHPTTTAQIND
jgi:hypothetical protein